MAHKVYGKPDPYALIVFSKKDISYFILNKLIKWDMATNTGNTKLVAVNKLIK